MMNRCGKCGGTGMVNTGRDFPVLDVQAGAIDPPVELDECPKCEGTGWLDE